MYKDLNQKVAVVTGGSKGIGTAISRRFGEEGMKVVINYNSDEKGAQKVVDLIKKHGGDAIAIHADISTEEGVSHLLETAVSEFGGLDVWVNNAGMENKHETNKLTLKDWQRVIDVNLTGTFLGSQKALNHFLDEDKPGSIINISSVHEQIPWPTFAHYSASKGGVKLLTQTMASEYARHNIRVNNIGPGAIKTPINAEKFDDPEQLEETTSMIPMKKIGEPKDVAAAAAWLASSESKYVTGITLFVDGGMTLYPAFMDGKG
ncbi:glucose-1-dehydrogenase [Holzapfeliella sp. JNUCC 72]